MGTDQAPRLRVRRRRPQGVENLPKHPAALRIVNATIPACAGMTERCGNDRGQLRRSAQCVRSHPGLATRLRKQTIDPAATAKSSAGASPPTTKPTCPHRRRHLGLEHFGVADPQSLHGAPCAGVIRIGAIPLVCISRGRRRCGWLCCHSNSDQSRPDGCRSTANRTIGVVTRLIGAALSHNSSWNTW